MPNIAICDDNTADRQHLVALTKQWVSEQKEEIDVRAFSSAYELLDAAAQYEPPDIFILDILMPEMTGISLGEQLQRYVTDPLLIYLTSSEDYYAEAFRLYAFQYLRKPVSGAALFPVLNKALARCKKQKNNVFSLKTSQGAVRIPVRTIAYIELRAHVAHVHLESGECIKSLYIRTGFDHFLEPLLEQARFVKTHVSFAVNLDFAARLATGVLSLTTGDSVPVARSFAVEVQRRYMAYGLRDEGSGTV